MGKVSLSGDKAGSFAPMLAFDVLDRAAGAIAASETSELTRVEDPDDPDDNPDHTQDRAEAGVDLTDSSDVPDVEAHTQALERAEVPAVDTSVLAPTSTRPPTAPSPASSRPPARPAWRAHG